MSNEHSKRDHRVMIQGPDGQRLDVPHGASLPAGFSEPGGGCVIGPKTAGPHGTAILENASPRSSGPTGTMFLEDAPPNSVAAHSLPFDGPSGDVLSNDVSRAFTELASAVFRANDASTMRYARSLVDEFERKFILHSNKTMVGHPVEERALYAHALESLKFQLNNWSMFDRMFGELANELREVRDEPQYLSELNGMRRVVEERISYMSLMKGWPPMHLLIRDYRGLLRETEERIAALVIRESERRASTRSWLGRCMDWIKGISD